MTGFLLLALLAAQSEKQQRGDSELFHAIIENTEPLEAPRGDRLPLYIWPAHRLGTTNEDELVEIGAAKLDAKTYEEVEHDESAIGQAMAVVALSVVASGIGSAGMGGVRGLVGGVFAALVGWFVWAGIIYVVGTKAMPEPQTKADFGQVLRTIGFAASPGVLNVFGIIPVFGMLIRLVVALWQLAATVVAVRQALDYKTTGKAVVVCVLGFIAYVAVGMFLGALGLAGMGMGSMM